MEPQLLADGANIREMKICAVNSLFASVNFLSQGRAFPWPSPHHLHVHKIHYSRTNGAPDYTREALGSQTPQAGAVGGGAPYTCWDLGWVCGVPPSDLLQPCMQPGLSMASLPGMVSKAEA